jgi:hypothetical protein
MGKLFCSILNTRLACYTKENKSIHPTQIGFISGNRTADHILTLKTLHDKYVKVRMERYMHVLLILKKRLTQSGIKAYI